MAIGFRSFTQVDTTLPGTLTWGLPSGATATDILVVIVGVGAGGGTTVAKYTGAAGWTRIMTEITGTSGLTQMSLGCWWALGNVASRSFTKDANTASDGGGVCLAFTGVDNTTPIDATGTANTNTGGASIVSNAVTIATDQSWHVVGLGSYNGGTWSNASFTIQQNGSPPPAAHEDGTCAYNTTPKSVGSTGTATFASSGGTSILGAMPFALRPAATATGQSASIDNVVVPNNRVGPMVLRIQWRGPAWPYDKTLTTTGNRRRRVIC